MDAVEGPLRGPDTASRDCWALTSAWYKECLQTHDMCSPSSFSPNFRPSRLLDVSGELLPNVKVCNHPESRMDLRYLTLSHCWGTIPFLRLQKDTFDVLTYKFPVSSLPRTFRDTVIFTRWLGFRFLWIDSLCIIQDSPEDWEQESTLMEKVYGNSALNLAATGAIDSSIGLFHSRDPDSLSTCVVQSSWSDRDNGLFALIDPDFWYNHVMSSPLLKRAWVQQEVILAPRVLHFGQSQLLWNCCELKACETFPKGLDPAIEDYDARLENLDTDPITRYSQHEADTKQNLRYLRWWATIVVRYTQCSLTKESDMLVALSGLAKQMGRKFQATYLAGLWSQDFMYQLLWIADVPSLQDSIRRPQSYRAPSWSWAAIESPVSLDTPFSKEDNWQLARVLDWGIVPATADVTGRIESGFVYICGNAFMASQEEDGSDTDDPISAGLDARYRPYFSIEAHGQVLQASASLDVPSELEGFAVYAVPLICTYQPEDRFISVQGILLRQMKTHAADTFARLGTF